MITSAKNPKYANPETTLIDLVVTHSKFGDIPFTASANDGEASGRELHARAVAGEFGLIAPYVARIKSPAEIEREAKAAQLAANTLAVKSDPAVIAMMSLTPAEQSAALDGITTIPQLRLEVTRLAKIVKILAEKLL